MSIRKVKKEFKEGQLYEVKNGELVVVEDSGIIEIETANNDLVVPAQLYPDVIATSDNKIFEIMSPGQVYEELLVNREPIVTTNYRHELVLNRIFDMRVTSVIKELVISSFNLLNNPAMGDVFLKDITDEGRPSFIFTREPSRQPLELFTTRETLELLLSAIDNNINDLPSPSVMDSHHTSDFMIDLSFSLMTYLYNVALNRVDCEKDIVNLNRFINTLITVLPDALVKLGLEYDTIYRDTVKSEYDQAPFII